MTDKEMLELAAKAAGIDPKWDGLFWQWNPLTDDRDALRLAARLLIDLHFYPDDGGYVEAWCEPWSDWLREDDLGDFPQAVRRAIVRVAAEVGKSMETK